MYLGDIIRKLDIITIILYKPNGLDEEANIVRPRKIDLAY